MAKEDIIAELSEKDKETLIKALQKQEKEIRNKEEEISRLETELSEKQEKINELEELSKKIKADYENYKKRMDKKLSKKRSRGKEEVIKELLEVVDSFNQALNLEKEIDQEFLEGIKNTRNLFFKKLGDMGLEEVSYKEFDPNLHQAIAKVDVDEEKQSDEIVEVVQRGYIFNDKVIRPALVKVQK